MKAILDDAAATLPEWKRTSTTMAEMASKILACAAAGERDPATLKIAALSVVVECSHYWHDISPGRRAIWKRERVLPLEKLLTPMPRVTGGDCASR